MRRAALLVSVLLSACGGGQPVKPQPKLNRFGRPLPEKADPPPRWIDAAPQNTKTRVYALGSSGPTFWPQDALQNANEDARGKLALSLSSKIEQLRRTSETAGTSGGSLNQLDLTKEATDLVMQNSRIEATWTDELGQRAEPGTVFALAIIDFEKMSGAALQKQGKNNDMPGWLDLLPANPGKLYAAGYSGPTFRPEDSLQNAGDAAIENLAHSLRSHVQAYTLLIETQTGLSVDDFSRTEDPDEQFLELVRKSARVEQIWVDEDGKRPGDPPGAVWALASIDVQSGKGGYQQVQNQDTGPALDGQGNAAPAPAPQAAPAAVPVTVPQSAPSAVPAAATGR